MKTEFSQSLIKEIGEFANLDPGSLIAAGIHSFLREKKKEILLEKLKFLSRYGVSDSNGLENKIRTGEIAEHPAWEDLIVVENLDAKLEQIDEYLGNL
ncbi:MAG: hypothetical protein GY795_10430 [Desulfobacterales bacterium]|nr:hypothetical protein [Desulfobacterales bacterium]